EIGQGSDTTWAMITAEVLGIPLDLVRVFSGDTDYSVDLGAYSSRQTLMTGAAVRIAAEDVKRQVLQSLSNEFRVEMEMLGIQDGYIVFKNPGIDFSHIRRRYLAEHRGWTDNPEGERLTFREAARIAFLSRGTIVGRGKYRPAVLGGKHKGAAVGTSPAYGCSAQITEVRVDLETGQIFVEKMTDAHDCGLAINKTSVEGQMQGSLHMGLGETLMEEVKFDAKGKILNANLGEYKIATALDTPNVNAIIVESREPYGPFGAKEVGEGAIMPTIPAILNAVYDATGVRIRELPLTPERVLKALQAAKQDKQS
ncbi:MAG: 4-hydroxybenzoyl-CoA reductase, partial [Planctomycetaceae bacterium]